jgi:molybdenum cofactor cytidylyltransferase
MFSAMKQDRYSEDIAGVILAAGRSTRMRGRNKLLVPVDGVPAIARICATALRTALSPVIVVLGHEREKVRDVVDAECGGAGLRYIYNSDYREGRMSSVAAAVREVRSGCGAAAFLRGDQPWISAALVNDLLEAFRRGAPPMVFPVYGGEKGSPTVVAARLFDRLLALGGDRGTLELAREFWDSSEKLPVDDPRCLRGIDTPEDLIEFGY